LIESAAFVSGLTEIGLFRNVRVRLRRRNYLGTYDCVYFNLRNCRNQFSDLKSQPCV